MRKATGVLAELYRWLQGSLMWAKLDTPAYFTPPLFWRGFSVYTTLADT